MTLIDGVERNAKNPSTFHIPPEEERKALAVGSFAKVGVIDGDHVERMWFMVRSVVDGKYIGELNNKPTLVSMKFGDLLTFGPENVLDLMGPVQPS